MGFNSLTLAKILTEIFKDIDFVHTITTLDKLHVISKGSEVEAYLKSYFSKTDSVAHEEIRQEASYIIKLFPHCSLEEIVNRLEVLGSEKNRVRVVLRQLVKGHCVRNNKRSLPNEAEAAVTNKKACNGELDLYNKPTTSKDCSLNRPCSSKSVKSEEGDECTDVFVPAGEEDYMQKCSDRLKEHLKNFCYQYYDLVHCLETAFEDHKYPDFATICKRNHISLYEIPTEEEQRTIFGEMLGSAKETDALPDVPDTTTETPDLPLNDDDSPTTPIPKIRISVKDLVYSSKLLLNKTEPDISVNQAVGHASVPETEEPEVPKNQGASHGAIPKVKPVPKIDQCVPPNSSSKMVVDAPTRFWLPKSALVKLPHQIPPRPTLPQQSTPPPAAQQSAKINERQEHVQGVSRTLNIIRQKYSHLYHPEEMLPNRVQKFLDSPYSFNHCRLPGTYTREVDIKTFRPVRLPGFPEDEHPSTFIPEADGKTQDPLALPVFPKKEEVITIESPEFNVNSVKRKRSPAMENDFFKFQNVEWRYQSSDSDTDSLEDMLVEEEASADLPVPPYHYKTASQLMEMFPDACPNYIKRLCANTGEAPVNADLLVDKIISDPNYPKRAEKVKSPIVEMDIEAQFKMLKELFPDADPNYLHYRAELYANDKEKLQEFIESTFENHDYPTIKEHLRKQQLSAQARQYTQAFKIEEFLKVIPDPEKYFNDPERKSSLADSDDKNTYEERQYALTVLKNIYSLVHVRSINTAFSANHYNVVKTANYLDAKCRDATGLMRSRRKPVDTDNFVIQNIPLLQEIAFVQHRKEIKVFLQDRQKKDLEERVHARENNLFCTCGCCYDDEVMPNAVATCEAGCVFCKECIQKSVEVLFGEGKLDYPCLSNCNSHFSLQTLQVVLTPKLFSKMVQKKQLQEIKAAGIEDLESCPFCDFATIPVPGDKIFHCMNPECMKESCRLCKEPSHVPLRCDEVEKDDDIKRRTYIENKMTEALLRKCHKCGLSFIKSDGCNKMTCSCGAMMCYVCGKAVHDYKHFNGQGGDRFDLCPLYSDTNKLHQESVLKGAELAKAEVGVNADPTKLKIDPTADVEKHYNEQKKKNPTVLPPGVMLGPNVMHIPEAGVHIAFNRHRHAQEHRRGHHHHHHHRRAF